MKSKVEEEATLAAATASERKKKRITKLEKNKKNNNEEYSGTACSTSQTKLNLKIEKTRKQKLNERKVSTKRRKEI